MLGAFFGLVSLVITAVAGLLAFGFTREFSRSRLRFVDAARNPVLPWVVGVITVVVAMPIAALLPLITGLTALVTGAAAGLGTASGVKALKRGD